MTTRTIVGPRALLLSVKALQKEGVKVVLCTARPFHSIARFGTNDLGINWDGYISSAGGVAYADGQYLRQKPHEKGRHRGIHCRGQGSESHDGTRGAD